MEWTVTDEALPYYLSIYEAWTICAICSLGAYRLLALDGRWTSSIGTSIISAIVSNERGERGAGGRRAWSM